MGIETKKMENFTDFCISSHFIIAHEKFSRLLLDS